MNIDPSDRDRFKEHLLYYKTLILIFLWVVTKNYKGKKPCPGKASKTTTRVINIFVIENVWYMDECMDGWMKRCDEGEEECVHVSLSKKDIKRMRYFREIAKGIVRWDEDYPGSQKYVGMKFKRWK